MDSKGKKIVLTVASTFAVGGGLLGAPQATVNANGISIAPQVTFCRPSNRGFINGTVATPLFSSATAASTTVAAQPGTQVIIGGTSNGRTQVTHGSVTGWVASSRVTRHMYDCPIAMSLPVEIDFID